MTNVAHHIRSRFDYLLDPLNADLIYLLITFYSVYDIIVSKTARDVPPHVASRHDSQRKASHTNLSHSSLVCARCQILEA